MRLLSVILILFVALSAIACSQQTACPTNSHVDNLFKRGGVKMAKHNSSKFFYWKHRYAMK